MSRNSLFTPLLRHASSRILVARTCTGPPAVSSRYVAQAASTTLTAQETHDESPKKPSAESVPTPAFQDQNNATTASRGVKGAKPSQSWRWTWETHTSTFSDLPVKRKLARHPGITKFLDLQELEDPPGMEFDLATGLLSVQEDFSERLHYVRNAEHHRVRPWVQKAFLQRAQAWQRLDDYDRQRVRQPRRIMNSTLKRHHGNMLGFPPTMLNMVARLQRATPLLNFHRQPDELGPELPSDLFGHMDGMPRNGVQVFVETFQRTPEPVQNPRPTCIWVAIKSPLRIAARNWESLARGEQPPPGVNTLAPILENLGPWLRRNYHVWRRLEVPENGSHVVKDTSREPGKQSSSNIEPMPPVILAWRQKYIWFVWKGGAGGKLIAQYASHWLPIHEVDNSRDLDLEIRSEQDLRRIREQELFSETAVGGNDDNTNGIPQRHDTELYF